MTTEIVERRQRRQNAPDAGDLGEPVVESRPAYAFARVDLLPPVVEIRRKQGRTVRYLVYGLVALVALVAAGGLAVSFLAMTAENDLAAERTRSLTLLNEQSQYSELSTVKSQLVDYDTAELAALFSEANWSRLMTELDGVLPADVQLATEAITVKGVSDAGTPEVVGLDAPGVIEIAFTANAATFDSPTPLLNALSTLTGYLSATVNAVSSTGEDGYTITGVVQLGTGALGGTARTDALDQEMLAQLHTLLEGVATGAVDSAAETDTTTDLDAATGAESGE